MWKQHGLRYFGIHTLQPRNWINSKSCESDSGRSTRFSPHDGQQDALTSSSNEEQNDRDAIEEAAVRWTPLFLKRWVLACFAIFFALFFAALQILYSYSATHQGIASSNDSKHYLWTYGPTAVLVLVTVGWRQVNYAAKSSQPWVEMANGPSRADRSLLLDYITPFQIFAIGRAIRNRHFLVVATIVVFFLLKVVTIISTGMLGLEILQISSTPKTIFLNSSFSGATFRGGLFVDSRPAYAVDGIQSYNLSYPAGTTDEYAVELFYPEEHDGVSTFTAPVNVFSASLSCQSGYLTYTVSYDEDVEIAPEAEYYNVSVLLSDCQIHNAHLDAPDWTSPGYHTGYYAQFQSVTCSNLAVDDAKRDRVMAAVAYSQGHGAINNNTMLNVSNVVCVPEYEIDRAMVTLDPTNSVLDVQLLNRNTSSLHTVSGYDIAQGVLMSLQSATNVVTSSAASLDAFFSLIENFDGRTFLNDAVLQSASQNLYSKIAVQVAAKFLMSSNDPIPTTSGSTSVVANRLVVRQVPLRFMEAISLLTLIIALFVIFAAPKAAVPRSMESLAALATILARSLSLKAILTGTGHLQLTRIREILDHHEFKTRADLHSGRPVFSIQRRANFNADLPYHPKHGDIIDAGTVHQEKKTFSNADEHLISKTRSLSGDSEAAVTWTLPLTFNPVAKLALVLSPCLMIVVLEVLLLHSNANAGLMDIAADSPQRYGWLYITTLLLVLLGTLFNMLDADIELFSPYHVLSAGYCSAQSSLLRCPSGNAPIYTVWQALRDGKVGLFAGSMSVLIAPFLTIVVSGLFTTLSVPLVQPITCQALDWFNTTGSIPDSDALTLGSLVVEGNMSYPQWTYGNIALPSIDRLPGYLHAATLAVRSPALRAGLRCDLIPKDQYLNITYEPSYSGSGTPTLVLNMSNPGQCSSSGTTVGANLSPVAASGYFGMMLGPLAFGGPDPETCPENIVFYVQMKSGAVEHLAGFNCNPTLERVEAKVIYNVPDYSLVRAPEVVANSAQPFSTSYYTGDLSANINTWFESLNMTTDDLSPFFEGIMYSKNGIIAAELINNTLLAEAIDRVAGITMAQILSTGWRQPLADLPKNQTDVPNTLKGTCEDLSRTRLVQSELSTRILEILLGILLLCVILIFLFIDMRKVLPKQPGSIAAAASMLADSRLLDEIPLGVEFMTDRQWKENGIWHGTECRMGWWDDSSSEGQRIFKIDSRRNERLI